MAKPSTRPSLKGAAMGLAAAFLFGCSMPLAKVLLAEVQPFVLAGLFYLGSGAGLALWCLLRPGSHAAEQAPLKSSDWPWLGSAILFGGVLAELLLMWGLKQASAADASLLLNLEGAFSALIAWTVFREHVNSRVLGGMVLLTSGAMILSAGPNWQLNFNPASLCIIAACLGWAIDNNLTRRVSHVDPVITASLKGLVAGVVNTAIGIAAGGSLPHFAPAATALLVGFLSYGVSLVLYIFSMRHVGTARASAYFSAAPFIGAGAAIVFLHEPLTAPFLAAAALMGTGIWLHLTEQHEHAHTHQPITHEHSHTHDEHHQHPHEEGAALTEPHSHLHVHEGLTHSHPHHPDLHHRHEH